MLTECVGVVSVYSEQSALLTEKCILHAEITVSQLLVSTRVSKYSKCSGEALNPDVMGPQPTLHPFLTSTV